MIQKILATLMTYSISFQLILGGIPIAMLTSTNAHANKCAEGLEWNAILNRCLTSRQAAQVQSASARCQRIQDKAAQNKCYTGALEQQVSDAERKGDIEKQGRVKTNVLPIILAMATLISSVTTLKYLSKDCKGATSAYLIAAASAAVFAGEVMSGMKFKKKSKEAFDEFQKIQKGENSTEGSEVQSEALAAMIKREEAVIEAAGTKKTFYTIAMAAYAAGGIMAILEARKYEAALAASATTGGASAAKAQLLFVCKASTVAAEAETPPQIMALNTIPPAPLDPVTSGQISNMGFNPNVTMMAYNSSNTSDKKIVSTRNDITPELENAAKKTIGTSLNDSLITKYLDSYFTKDLKVNFERFSNDDLVISANNFAEFYQINSEISRFQSGELISTSLDDYHETVVASRELGTTVSDEEFSMMKFATVFINQFSIQNAHSADLLKGIGMILGMGAVAYAGATMLVAQSSKITKLFLHPYTRASLSGIMTVVSVSQRSHMDKEKKKAEERKAFIEKLQLQVEAAGNGFGSCTQEQRNSDMSKPHCFCYLQGGSINTARVKSATCKAFFGSGLAKNMARPTSVSSAREPATCTAPNATVIDESCSCRRTNTCTSVPRASFTSTGAGPSTIANMDDVLNGINNGSLRAEDIKPEQMLAKAAGLGKILNKLEADPNNKSLIAKVRKADELGRQTLRGVAGQLAASPALMNSGLGSLGSGAPGTGSAQDEIKKLQEEFKKDMSQYEPGEVAGGNGAALGAAGDDFSLDAVSGGGVTVEGDEKLAEVMDTNFESSGSDINSNSDANIFQILTYRYQRSAMRRLFGGEAMLPADKANETEISE